MDDKQEQCPLTAHMSSYQSRSGAGIYAYECPACGIFEITRQAKRELRNPESEYYNRRYVLASIVRNASDREQTVTITSYNLDNLLDSVVPPKTPYELIDNVLLLAETRGGAGQFWDRIPFNSANDFPVVVARNKAEAASALSEASHQGLLDMVTEIGSFYVAPKGWERIEELRRTSVVSNQAFAAMWFDKQMDNAWTDGIKPALEATGYTPIRVDKEQFNDKIDDKIIAEIRRSGLLVADVTDHRQGVYFEAGFAMGLGVPIIWTCREDHIEKAHFDTRQYNHIVWKDAADLKEQLINRIEATLPNRVRKTTTP